MENPTAAGRKASLPIESDISIAGIRSDQTDAATITPDANPSNAFCTSGFKSFFKKNTQAAPSVVPKKGINNPIAISKNVPPYFYLNLTLHLLSAEIYQKAR